MTSEQQTGMKREWTTHKQGEGLLILGDLLFSQCISLARVSAILEKQKKKGRLAQRCSLRSHLFFSPRKAGMVIEKRKDRCLHTMMD